MILPRNILARGASPNEKLNIALIGVGNQGGHQVDGIAKTGDNVVAICDVDQRMLNQRKAVDKFPQAPLFRDFRKMYDEMLGKIDAVCISTPDHTHYHPAIRAIREKKHFYLEKPMAHSVAECRILTDEAAKYGVATQLGCQRHIWPGIVNAVRVIKEGVIGEVTEVYSWIRNPRGMPPLPEKTPAPPQELDWDLWLGPCLEHYDYGVFTDNKGQEAPCYAPYNWRLWWDFGTAETGNWGCHILDIPYWALDLKYPIKVSTDGDSIDSKRVSKEIHCHFVFPKRGNLPEVLVHWEGALRPSCYDKYQLSDTLLFSEGCTPVDWNTNDTHVFSGVVRLLNATAGSIPKNCLDYRDGKQIKQGDYSTGYWNYKGQRWGDGRAMSFVTCLPPNAPSCSTDASTAGTEFTNTLFTASSYHSGGVNASMADGSVRFVSDTVDCGATNKRLGEGSPGWTLPATHTNDHTYSGPSTFGVWGGDWQRPLVGKKRPCKNVIFRAVECVFSPVS